LVTTHDYEARNSGLHVSRLSSTGGTTNAQTLQPREWGSSAMAAATQKSETCQTPFLQKKKSHQRQGGAIDSDSSTRHRRDRDP
jgi:hypothetical protein